MKKPGTLFLAIILLGILISGCGAKKEMDGHVSKP